MKFEWMDRTPPRTDGSQQRARAAASELAHRAGTLFRLGYSQDDATKRLCSRVAWEFDQPSTQGNRRPDELSDAAIAKIVADTFARRPGGW